MADGTDASRYQLEYDDRALRLLRDGTAVGRLDWRPGPDVIHVDYVHVDPALRGQGLGARLVDAAADHARQTGRRLIPLCGFARRVLYGSPRYHDVLASPSEG